MRLLLLLSLLLPSAALAEQKIDLKPAEPGHVVLSTWGEYRINVNLLDDFAVDAEAEPTTHGQERWVDHRIRAGIGLQVNRLTFKTEWDFLNGSFAGDTWNLSGLDARARDRHNSFTLQGITPRRLSIMARWAPVDVELGLVTSHWGLGMLANGGDKDPYFGRNDFGDRVIRLRVTGRPLYGSKEEDPNRNKLLVTGAFDLVVADDFGTMDDGQLAMQGIVSLLYADPGHCMHGIYVVYRHQREPEGAGTTDAFVLDGYFDQTFKLPGAKLRVAAEAALLAGTTSRTLNYNSTEEMQIGAFGVTGLAALGLLEDRLQIHLRTGFGSGDDDPDDSFSRTFGFDRDFDAGMVLFDQLLGSVAAGTHALLVDPTKAGSPPRGVDGALNEGQVRSAFFLQPVLIGKPLDFLELKGGVMMAWDAADHRQPFYSFRAGGSARNHHNRAPGNRMLGTELNWSVVFGGDLPFKAETAPKLNVAAIVQGGHLVVGDALASTDDGGEVINHVQITGRFRW
jgi:hypothetical protein